MEALLPGNTSGMTDHCVYKVHEHSYGLYCSLTVGVLKKKTSPSTSSSLFLSVRDRKFTNYVSTQWMKQTKLYHPNVKVLSDIRRVRGVDPTVPSKDGELLCDVTPDSPYCWGPARCTVPHVGVPFDVQIVEVVCVFHLASFGTLQPLDDLSFHLHGYVSWQQGKQKAFLQGREEREADFRRWWERLPGGEASAPLMEKNHNSSWGGAISLYSYLLNSQ